MKIITHTKQNSAYYIKLFLIIVFTTFKMQAASLSSNKIEIGKSKYTIQTNRIWLNVTSTNGAFSQTLFGYRTGATDGVDNGLDGPFWNDGAISLASLIGDTRYAIQFKGLPFSNTDVVQLSFNASSTGTYTFAIDHTDGFFLDPSFTVYLHDKVTNTYTNLKTGSYTFESNSGLYNNRFELAYLNPSSPLATPSNQFRENNLDVYKTENSVTIKSGDFTLNSIQLYSINGQILYNNNNINTNEITISSLNISQQTIIVRATTNDGITVVKKWLYL